MKGAASALVALRALATLATLGAVAAVGLAGCPGAGPDCADDGVIDALADCDGDGFTPAGGDCDDGDPGTSPDAVDVPGDGIDQDCEGGDATAAGDDDVGDDDAGDDDGGDDDLGDDDAGDDDAGDDDAGDDDAGDDDGGDDDLGDDDAGDDDAGDDDAGDDDDGDDDSGPTSFPAGPGPTRIGRGVVRAPGGVPSVIFVTGAAALPGGGFLFELDGSPLRFDLGHPASPAALTTGQTTGALLINVDTTDTGGGTSTIDLFVGYGPSGFEQVANVNGSGFVAARSPQLSGHGIVDADWMPTAGVGLATGAEVWLVDGTDAVVRGFAYVPATLGLEPTGVVLDAGVLGVTGAPVGVALVAPGDLLVVVDAGNSQLVRCDVSALPTCQTPVDLGLPDARRIRGIEVEAGARVGQRTLFAVGSLGGTFAQVDASAAIPTIASITPSPAVTGTGEAALAQPGGVYLGFGVVGGAWLDRGAPELVQPAGCGDSLGVDLADDGSAVVGCPALDAFHLLP